MSHNPHIPRLTESTVECSAPGCSHVWYVGSDAVERAKERTPRDPVAFFTSIWGNHSRQFEPGGAPDITVEWELVAHCSVCPDKVGDVVTNDSESVVCNECGTTWGMDGESGETDEYALEEIREAAHEEAISHAEWLIADRDALANIDRERERERIMSHLARVPAPVPSMPRHLAVFHGSGRGYGKRAAMRAAGAFRHFPGLPVLDPYADPVGDVRAIVAKWGRNLANGIGSRFVVSHDKAPGALAAAALGPVRLGMDFGVVDSPIMCLYPDGSVRPLEDAE